MKVAELLDCILTLAVMPKVKKVKYTWSLAEEQRFKACLAKVKTKAYIEDGVLFVRSENVGKFKELIDGHGLAGCVVAQRETRILLERPGESFKFQS